MPCNDGRLFICSSYYRLVVIASHEQLGERLFVIASLAQLGEAIPCIITTCLIQGIASCLAMTDDFSLFVLLYHGSSLRAFFLHSLASIITTCLIQGDCFVPRNDKLDCFVPRNDGRFFSLFVLLYHGSSLRALRSLAKQSPASSTRG